MDVAGDRDLRDFIDSLDAEEAEANVNIWTNIEDALNNWSQRVLDAESQLNKSGTFHHQIEDSIRRLQLDGLLSSADITELRYIGEVWMKLMSAASSYGVGCKFAKRDIITYLLELHTLKQITNNLFIEICFKL